MWLTLRTESRLVARQWKSHAAIALALAVGLAIAGTLVNLTDSIVWRPLRVPAAERLVAVEAETPDGKTWSPVQASPAQILMLQRQAGPGLPQVAGLNSSGARTLTLSAKDLAVPVRFAIVTPGFFSLFDLPEPFSAGPSDVANVVVSYDLWNATLRPAGVHVGDVVSVPTFDPQTFGTRPRPLRVTTVAPAGFHFPDDTQVWLPATTEEAHFPHFMLVGRLGTGLTPQAVASSGTDVLEGFRATIPGTLRTRSLREATIPRESWFLSLLVIATAGLLLTVWCQTALFSASAALTDRRALGTRLALGASRRRLVMELMVGPMWVTLVALPIGVALGLWLHHDVVTMLPFMEGRRSDYGLVAVCCSVTAATAFLAAQALLIVRVVARHERHTRVSRHPADAPTLIPARLAAFSAGISLCALYISLLLSASFYRTLRHDYGFTTTGVLAVNTSAMVAGLKDPVQQRARMAALVERAKALPGVGSVSRLNGAPFGGYDVSQDARVVLPDGERTVTVKVRETGRGLFETLGVPMLAGRDFRSEETIGTPVAIVSESVARTLWLDGGAVLESLRLGDDTYTVVGVVADFSDRASRGAAPTVSPQVFLPSTEGSELVVRTSGDAAVALDALLAAAEPYQPFLRVSGFTYDERRAMLAANEQAYARFMGALAAGALLIAAVGGFATVAQATRTSRKASAIRLGLGANLWRALLASVAGAVSWLVAGSILGIFCGIAAGQVLANSIRNIQAPEPSAIVLSAAVAGAVVALSLVAPAIALQRLDVSALLKDSR